MQNRYRIVRRIGIIAGISLVAVLTHRLSTTAQAVDACDTADEPHEAHAAPVEADAHAGHDHEEHEETPAAEDPHAGHDHAAHDEAPVDDPHAGHDHGSEGLQLTAQQRTLFGITVATAGPGVLGRETSLQGEITFNEDRVVHMVPRAAGIAEQVRVRVGDSVVAGETLALVDSAELASAKLDYFAAITEVGCCALLLPRTKSIHDNVATMLTFLKTSPTLEELRTTASGTMGAYRARLITAYADYVFSKATYERERALASRKISTEGDLQAAENGFKKHEAIYLGTLDAVAFEVQQELLETVREQDVAVFEADTARQKLRMLGQTSEEIVGLAPIPVVSEPKGHVCTDPNCKNCQQGDFAQPTVPAGAGDEALGIYAVKAPIDGVIVEKHIALGERVGDATDVLTIADTSSVWVNLAVYAKDRANVAVGQDVVIEDRQSGLRTEAMIEMVTPFLDPVTRSATARVVLDNTAGKWIPGTFVTGIIESGQQAAGVVVPRDAVQTIDDESVVFVEHEGTFETVPVTLGRTDRQRVEVASGLAPGTRYVSDGAFHLKATIVTSSLDPHAGHGH